jgi:hypothetical protein
MRAVARIADSRFRRRRQLRRAGESYPLPMPVLARGEACGAICVAKPVDIDIFVYDGRRELQGEQELHLCDRFIVIGRGLRCTEIPFRNHSLSS